MPGVEEFPFILSFISEPPIRHIHRRQGALGPRALPDQGVENGKGRSSRGFSGTPRQSRVAFGAQRARRVPASGDPTTPPRP